MVQPGGCPADTAGGQPVKRLLMALAVLAACPAWSAEATRPAVLGFGVNNCQAYVQVFKGWQAGEEQAIVAYLRYRAWFTGLVTGLSLATDLDVLNGVETTSAMQRLQLHCEEHAGDDFFTASMGLIRTLSGGR